MILGTSLTDGASTVQEHCIQECFGTSWPLLSSCAITFWKFPIPKCYMVTRTFWRMKMLFQVTTQDWCPPLPPLLAVLRDAVSVTRQWYDATACAIPDALPGRLARVVGVEIHSMDGAWKGMIWVCLSFVQISAACVCGVLEQGSTPATLMHYVASWLGWPYGRVWSEQEEASLSQPSSTCPLWKRARKGILLGAMGNDACTEKNK